MSLAKRLVCGPDASEADVTAELAHRWDEGWRLDAVCRGMGPQAFFGRDHGDIGRPSMAEVHRRITAAKKICKRCPVRDECLEEALATPHRRDYGIWGGTTRAERMAMRRRRPTSR